jgi:hypothetical protein
VSLDDLRARAHAANKKAAELANELDRLAVDLQNYQPDPGPGPDPEPPSGSSVEYGLFCYNDPLIDARWTAQTLQGQPGTVSRLAGLREAGVRRLYRYTFPLTFTDHPQAAYRMGADPGTFKRSWLALRSGQTIRSSKFDSGDGYGNYLIDVGILEYQKASAQWLIHLCRTQGWDGIYLDEINEFQSYAGYLVPSAYPNDYRFQLAQLAYVQHVSNALHNAGFECHVNLASNDNQWRKNVASAVDGTHVEFFLVQWTVNSPDAWHVASLENGEFRKQLDWLVWNEKAGKVTTCQADAKTEAEVGYALASLLLVTTGKARFAARKNQSYGVGQGWWTPAMDNARKLGQPKAAYTVSTQGVYQREFEHGRVSVNPSEKPINTLPATSGLIELR